jgi:hypothetical protein
MMSGTTPRADPDTMTQLAEPADDDQPHPGREITPIRTRADGASSRISLRIAAHPSATFLNRRDRDAQPMALNRDDSS